MSSLLVPPASVRGQLKLDREAFDRTVEKIPCLYLSNKLLNERMPILKKYLLKLRNFKAIQSYEGDVVVVYLDPEKINTPSGIPEYERETLFWSSSFRFGKIELNYDNWSSDEVLRAVLPVDVEVPTSYSLVGHIVHVNLRDEQIPFKNLIGEIFLDKIPNSKTVVNKTSSIDSAFRFFQMEILAGQAQTKVTVKENDCTYQLDFAKVYWNPRLSTEHMNIVKLLNTGDTLYDVFTGIGPFAIPAARKGIKVLANDLNPACYYWLLKNARANKVLKSFTAFNLDGREFLEVRVKQDILRRREENAAGGEHIVMNLPALAVEFLDVFANWADNEEIDKILACPPRVHVYTFIKAGKQDDIRKISKNLMEEKLKVIISQKMWLEVYHVRNVAPNKEMMRISFFLTEEILKSAEPARKKLKSQL